MNNKKKIEISYNKMLKVVDRDYRDINLNNRTNCYICKKCNHITKTKDIDKGVTPMFFTCEKCGDYAHSSFYKDIAPELTPTIEWYRPSLEETLTLYPALQQHILNGGLNHRKINKT